MAWIILVFSAVMEAVWATALGLSDGFSRPVPVVVFFLGLLVSMATLARAARSIPMGTAYAVWAGLGATITVAASIALGQESVSVWKLVFMAGIVGSIVGLKLTHGADDGEGSAEEEPRALRRRRR